MTRKVRPRADELDDKTRELLARRSDRLRLPPEAPAEQRLTWIAEFSVGEARYAIPLDALRAAVPLRRVTNVPLAPPHVVGILRFGGQIITALSMASLLGIRGWSHDPEVLLVVDPGTGGLVALDCEEIPRPTSLSERVLEEAKEHATGSVTEVMVESRPVRVIDLAKLVKTGAGDGS